MQGLGCELTRVTTSRAKNVMLATNDRETVGALEPGGSPGQRALGRTESPPLAASAMLWRPHAEATSPNRSAGEGDLSRASRRCQSSTCPGASHRSPWRDRRRGTDGTWLGAWPRRRGELALVGRVRVTAPLNIPSLLAEAEAFGAEESAHREPTLYGVTDGKAIGTYLEHKFRDALDQRYRYDKGSSAKGIDFPSLAVDMKVTSVRQPQSSSPFRSARQKIRGLGYSLLVFVYQKDDDEQTRTGQLDILHTVFVDSRRTGDYQTTRGIRDILDRDGNVDDLVAFMNDRNLPIDSSEAVVFAEELLAEPPRLGYLTISNALQWRLQYRRVIDVAGSVGGVVRVS